MAEQKTYILIGNVFPLRICEFQPKIKLTKWKWHENGSLKIYYSVFCCIQCNLSTTTRLGIRFRSLTVPVILSWQHTFTRLTYRTLNMNIKAIICNEVKLFFSKSKNEVFKKMQNCRKFLFVECQKLFFFVYRNSS